jgi:hypothetical protein
MYKNNTEHKEGKKCKHSFQYNTQLGSRHSSSNAASIIESNPPEKRTATGASSPCLISQVTAYAFHLKRIQLVQKSINQTKSEIIKLTQG